MREREEQQMNNRKKMIVGIASLAGGGLCGRSYRKGG